MGRTIVLYALALGGAAIALDWLEFRYVARQFSLELYITVVAIGGAMLGAWLAHRLTTRPAPAGPFTLNRAAIRSLGLSARELEILSVLASGESNKEIARRLHISPNTVKTHVANVYAKLGVTRRIMAVEQARMLALIP